MRGGEDIEAPTKIEVIETRISPRGDIHVESEVTITWSLKAEGPIENVVAPTVSDVLDPETFAAVVTKGNKQTVMRKNPKHVSASTTMAVGPDGSSTITFSGTARRCGLLSGQFTYFYDHDGRIAHGRGGQFAMCVREPRGTEATKQKEASPEPERAPGTLRVGRPRLPDPQAGELTTGKVRTRTGELLEILSLDSVKVDPPHYKPTAIECECEEEDERQGRGAAREFCNRLVAAERDGQRDGLGNGTGRDVPEVRARRGNPMHSDQGNQFLRRHDSPQPWLSPPSGRRPWPCRLRRSRRTGRPHRRRWRAPRSAR